ncbi:MAG: DNA repair protein RecN (Recombination protein N) [Verrucomicrobiales bacterium]|jgi:DNA repair protein RecN (Recombination protein N)
MLEELRIQNLGVIEDLSLVLPAGSIAVTGETGAGKTMVVGAIQLLMGGRAEPDMVRIGAAEAVVEGRFVDRDGTEIVARRVIPTDGRSRAYLDGSLATATGLQERVGHLIDLHGQHSQQSLLRPATQRDALDRFAGIDRAPLRDARADVAAIDAALVDLGGDTTERARQIDLLRYQIEEVQAAELDDPEESERLVEREAVLANAYDHEIAAGQAGDLLGSDGPAADALGQAAAIIADASPFASASGRIQALQEELADISAELRSISEHIVDDPEARAIVRARLQLLVELRRKYGPTLGDVMAYAGGLQEQLDQLESHEGQVAELTIRRIAATENLATISNGVRLARTTAASPLAKAVEKELSKLAMANAKVEITVDGEAGDDVAVLLAPNPGLPMLPVGKNASGGELSRTMLALRLVLAGGPPVKVFDEVDAGIGGETARAVGQALSSLGDTGQVFVVTHLAQVASFAGHHIVIDKSTRRGATASQARILTSEERVIEVSRMLSGSPDSIAAHEHAEELLAATSASWGT